MPATAAHCGRFSTSIRHLLGLGQSIIEDVARIRYLHTHVETSVIFTNLGTLADYLRYRSLLELGPV